MIDWENILSKREFTDDELKIIPNFRCETMLNMAQYYKEIKNIPYEKLYEGFSNPEVITNTKNWVSIFDNIIFIRNIIKNSKEFMTHKDFFNAGIFIKYSENLIYLLAFKILSCAQSIRETNRNVKLFTNSYEMNSFGLRNGFSYLTIKKIPFFTNYSLGQECRYTEGTFAANFEAHHVKYYTTKHLICEETLENIIKNHYSKYSLQYKEVEHEIFINNILVGKKVCLKKERLESGELLYTDLVDITSTSYNAIKIINNFKINDRIVFERGEIYNAPCCCLKFEWKEPSFLNRMANIIKSKTLLVEAAQEIESQIEFSTLKSYELYTTLEEVEEFNYTLEQRIADSTLEIESKNIELKKFFGKVSHEIRTPLNALIGYSNVLIDGENNNEKLKKLNIISEASGKLLKFVNEIVAFANLETSHSELNYKKISIKKILENVQQFNFFELKRKNLFFDYNIDKTVPDEIVTDELKLFQIINNLVENAIKFTEIGGIYIACSYSKKRILIEITDTGVGIPESQKSNIFNIFERLNLKKDGFGLGLAIVKMIVETLGGEIWLESKLNIGTNFFIKLPDNIDSVAEMSFFNNWLRDSNRTEKEKDIFYMALNDMPFLSGKLRKAIYTNNLEALDKAIRNFREISAVFFMEEINDIVTDIANEILYANPDFSVIKTKFEYLDKIIMDINYREIPYLKFLSNETITDFKVLIVDDNIISLNLVKEFLSQINIKCDLAQNGSVALEKLETEKYNTILLDIEMPVLNGEDTIKIIRKDNRFSDLHIIALTASATIGSKERYIKMGFDDYLSKPINKEILIRVLNLKLEFDK